MSRPGRRVVMRVDASSVIGTGHVVRCLTLAGELERRDAAVEFVCREMSGDLADLIRARGYPVHRLPPGKGAPLRDATAVTHAAWLETDWRTDAGQTLDAIGRAGPRPAWLVVDHYALDARWQGAVRPHVDAILAIDDIADRPHAADLVLDQNYPADDDRYAARVLQTTRVLLGPSFALIDGSYRDARAHLRPRVGDSGRWVVFFGGVDLVNETTKVLAAIAGSRWHSVAMDVVVGAGNPHGEVVAEAVRALPNARLHVQVPTLAPLFAAADVAIGAGGTSTWERCCLGLPSVLVATAVNQVPTLTALARDGFVAYLGRHEGVTGREVLGALDLTDDRRRLADMAARCLALVDGGGAGRVADAMGMHASGTGTDTT